MTDTKWECKKFKDLSVENLYSILKLRSEVFVVEQNCVYLDADGKDEKSYHLCGWLNEELVAYVRILPPGISYEEASIGRVCTKESYRKNGAGKLLMQKAIAETYRLFNTNSIKIGAQLYLLSFYNNLDFQQSSGQYIEDGIPHIEMLHTK